MKVKAIKSVTKLVKICNFKFKKHGPTILLMAGAAGTITGTILACKETTKLGNTLDNCKERKEEIKENKENYSNESEYRKDLAIVTIKNAYDIAKLYAPAAIIEGLSLGMIFASNFKLQKRNASLAAAYATLDSIYKKYRKNVVDTFGEDVDRDMRFGIKHEKIEEEITDENGKTKKIKKEVSVIDYDPEDPNYISEYARFYDSSVAGWDKNPELNMMQLKSYQNYANDLLDSQGFLFLNDVYDMIGFDPSIAGQSVGWIKDKNNPYGDGYIDFGIFEARNANRRFVNGLEPVILLDFNIDGDLLKNPKLNALLEKKIKRK